METLILLFTYNEKENISALIKSILSLNYPLHIIVVDDDSPDGTWQVVRELAVKCPQITLLRRMRNRGRGSAEIEGFKYVLSKKFEFKYILEMDADFSHNPIYIPLFLRKIKEADVVIGSRYLKGGRDERRSLLRRCISKLAADCIRRSLQINISDPSSGYRCFRREILQGIDVASLSSRDQFITTEVLFRCCKKGYRIKEVPIVFSRRACGNSKLRVLTLFTYLLRLLLLRFGKLNLWYGIRKAYP